MEVRTRVLALALMNSTVAPCPRHGHDRSSIRCTGFHRTGGPLAGRLAPVDPAGLDVSVVGVAAELGVGAVEVAALLLDGPADIHGVGAGGVGVARSVANPLVAAEAAGAAFGGTEDPIQAGGIVLALLLA